MENMRNIIRIKDVPSNTIEEAIIILKENKKANEEESLQEKSMITFFENKMKDILGSKVSIKNKKNNKGKIEIEYYSKDELERIIDLIQSIKE